MVLCCDPIQPTSWSTQGTQPQPQPQPAAAVRPAPIEPQKGRGSTRPAESFREEISGPILRRCKDFRPRGGQKSSPAFKAGGGKVDSFRRPVQGLCMRYSYTLYRARTDRPSERKIGNALRSSRSKL